MQSIKLLVFGWRLSPNRNEWCWILCFHGADKMLCLRGLDRIKNFKFLEKWAQPVLVAHNLDIGTHWNHIIRKLDQIEQDSSVRKATINPVKKVTALYGVP